jgi:hypothetical protein
VTISAALGLRAFAVTRAKINHERDETKSGSEKLGKLERAAPRNRRGMATLLEKMTMGRARNFDASIASLLRTFGVASRTERSVRGLDAAGQGLQPV